jgi:putative DNA primase/helicase
LEELRSVAAVVIDPISAYLSETDSHKNADVRAVLAPLSELAARQRVAIIGVSHLSKAAGAKALMRVNGSLAFVGAARGAYLVASDPADKTRRLFLPMKNNLGPDATGLAYRIEGASVESPAGPLATARVLWDSESVPMTADEAMQAESGSGSTSAADEAADWLREALAEGPMAANEISKLAAAEAISKKTLRRAREKLGIKPVKPGMKDGWIWALPPKMPKTAEDAQQNDVGTFGDIGHLREIDGGVAPEEPRDRTDFCKQCGPTKWRWDGTAWVCAGCGTPGSQISTCGRGRFHG